MSSPPFGLFCPYCGQKAMNEFQKLSLGPMRKVRCSQCSQKVGLSLATCWYFLPLIFLIIGITVFKNLGYMNILLACYIGFLCYLFVLCFLYLKLPLIKKN